MCEWYAMGFMVLHGVIRYDLTSYGVEDMYV